MVTDDQRPEMIEGLRIVASVTIDGDAVVLLDPHDRPDGIESWHPYQNVLRVTADGSVVWRAELVPNETTVKCYLELMEQDGNLIASTYNFVVILDAETGKPLRIDYTK